MRASRSSLLMVFIASLCIGTALSATGQNDSPATSSATTTTAGLTDVKSAFDTLRVLPSALNENAPLKIIVMPLSIDYAKRRDLQPYYRDSDFQLSPRDTALLQKTLTETFANSWFKHRQWQLVTDATTADLTLKVEFRNFWLAAPLQENIIVSRTYAEESARFTLSGRIERISDGQSLVEFSDKRKVRPLGAPPGKIDRFSAVTFWRDTRYEIDNAARQLNRYLPSGKNGQKAAE